MAPRKQATAPKIFLDVYFKPKDMHETLKDGFSGTVDQRASVFLAGVMQYMATELLEVSTNAAQERNGGKAGMITDIDVRTAIQTDKDLRETFMTVYRESMERGEMSDSQADGEAPPMEQSE